jgi:hypothetical protein
MPVRASGSDDGSVFLGNCENVSGNTEDQCPAPDDWGCCPSRSDNDIKPS